MGRPKARAVEGIDFEVKRGEVFGLLGPNGSGKSTTVKMLLGLLYPTRGRITVFDHSPRHVQTKARIGYLPEESYLYRYLNSDETIDFFGSLFHIDSKERRERAEQLIEMVGLENARRRHVGEFSKGMQRRIGLAQALALIPGTSRSGITMTAGRLLGMERRECARFSMLLSIPVIIGAGSLKGWQLYQSGNAQLTYDALLSAGLAFAAALIAIAALMAWLIRSSFTPFVLYRIFLGGFLLTAVYGWVG